MIRISSPSFALNDERSPTRYQMDFNEKVGPTDSMQDIVDMIAGAALATRGNVLQNLVINAHGLPGQVILGTGLNKATMAPFAGIAGKVRKIWLASCLAARILPPAPASGAVPGSLQSIGIAPGDGHDFVSRFARLTRCYVVAATEVQGVGRQRYPRGVLSSYEGLLLCYNPQGAISWRHRYPSIYALDLAAGTVRSHNHE